MREETVARRRLTYELSAAGLPRSGLEEVCLSGGGEARLGDTPTLQWSAYKLLCHQPPTLHIPLSRDGLGRFWKICEESFLIFIAFLEILFLLPIIFWLRYWHFDIVLNSSLNR